MGKEVHTVGTLDVRISSVMRRARANGMVVPGIAQGVQTARVDFTRFDAASANASLYVATRVVRFALERYDRFTMTVVRSDTIGRANAHNGANRIRIQHLALLIRRANSRLPARVFTFLIDTRQLGRALRVLGALWSNRSPRI